MTNKSFIAGILTIISGAIGVLWLAGAWLCVYMVRIMFRSPVYGPMPDEFLNLMSAFYLGWGIIGAAAGIIGIAGGIFALKRRHWGWALAGAIIGVITFFPTGIAALVLLSMGKEEFQSLNPSGRTQ
jgi:hypothetical protein